MINKEMILAPSLLAADYNSLGSEICNVYEAGAKYIHLDVMDGMFVPSISFGMPVIKGLRSCCDIVFDVHLMIEEPDRYVEDFKNSGADLITVHQEACRHLDRTLNHIKALGLKAAVALNPATPVDTIKHVLPICDMVLIMSVNPGFGGQKYIAYATEKVAELSGLRQELGLDFDIEVDGGVTLDNVLEVKNAGANVFVAGSAVFKNDAAANVKSFMKLLNS